MAMTQTANMQRTPERALTPLTAAHLVVVFSECVPPLDLAVPRTSCKSIHVTQARLVHEQTENTPATKWQFWRCACDSQYFHIPVASAASEKCSKAIPHSSMFKLLDFSASALGLVPSSSESGSATKFNALSVYHKGSHFARSLIKRSSHTNCKARKHHDHIPQR